MYTSIIVVSPVLLFLSRACCARAFTKKLLSLKGPLSTSGCKFSSFYFFFRILIFLKVFSPSMSSWKFSTFYFDFLILIFLTNFVAVHVRLEFSFSTHYWFNLHFGKAGTFRQQRASQHWNKEKQYFATKRPNMDNNVSNWWIHTVVSPKQLRSLRQDCSRSQWRSWKPPRCSRLENISNRGKEIKFKSSTFLLM